MTAVTFDGVSLPEAEVKRQPEARLNSSSLVSGKKKLTASTVTETTWQISCVCSTAEYAALLAKIATIGSLVIDGTTHTKCGIKSWKEKEINPSTIEVTITLEQDTS